VSEAASQKRPPGKKAKKSSDNTRATKNESADD
jgi:hypothetical protein